MRDLVASFANGVANDEVAVPKLSCLGPTASQITKLKLVKGQMYGREKIDLLRARLIGDL